MKVNLLFYNNNECYWKNDFLLVYKPEICWDMIRNSMTECVIFGIYM